MDYQDYKELYDSLSGSKDVIDFISKGYDDKLIKTLYTQKINRDVKKKFYAVKSKSKLMLKLWKEGATMMEISEKFKFPPILIAMMIFQQDGASKKEFWNYVNNPDQLNDETANELKEVIGNDLIYSPAANEEQRQRGKWGEALLHQWLDEQGIGYRTEDDLKGIYEKTPDALLDEPMLYNGKKIFWVESKASFGDDIEFKYNSKKQLIPYTKIFGPGIVVYWIGCLNNLKCPENIYVADISILEDELIRVDE
ncbi:MAG: C15orf41 family protein [archaeon]|nr:C15orf41 family protein [archaeon]